MPGATRGVALLVGCGALAALTGCSSAAEPDVNAVARAFENSAGDPEARCDLLAPATLATFESDRSGPCADTIADVPLPGGEVSSVQVWGGEAQVRLGGDTLFLTQTDAGWRVVAAGCESRGQAPYDCEVEGP
jgi:hypothetical protein